MYFVTAEDFTVAPYIIPNVATSDAFAPFVNKEELLVLKDILGSLLYDEFITQLELLPDPWTITEEFDTDDETLYGSHVWKSLVDDNVGNIPVAGADWELVPDTIWIKLLYGEKYYSDSKSYDWVGMNKLFVPYIYAMFTRADTEGNDTGLGTIIPDAENSTVVSSALKVSRAYNDFSRVVGNRCSLKDTLYGYLYNSEDRFLSVVVAEYSTIKLYLADRFKDPGEMNVFNL